ESTDSCLLQETCGYIFSNLIVVLLFDQFLHVSSEGTASLLFSRLQKANQLLEKADDFASEGILSKELPNFFDVLLNLPLC
uniref:Nexin_C domain-containing protein n=1 Tax=Mesocestoides corti TaxID=53468 RepID=A0A5K3ERS9_MESCO